jgi:DNA-binding NtrC family response regulator
MQHPDSILVIDDEHSICMGFKRFFEDRGWVVHLAASGAEGLATFHETEPTVVFLDVRLPDRSGLDLLSDIAPTHAGVIVITAYGGMETVIRAIQGKAFDYLVKPLDLDRALTLADRVRGARRASDPIPTAQRNDKPGALIGDSPAMQDIYKLIARTAASISPVLIQGQTGTGKELVARAIHQFSPRREGPFVAINCGAIPENLIESELFGHVRGAFTSASIDRIGRFEMAHKGCLLLDEIGDLPLPIQVKLLRVLDTGAIERVGSSESLPLDVRVLAATNKDLREEVRQGRFRQDLYFRLAVLSISMPPLRDRMEDIPKMAAHFLRVASASGDSHPGLSSDALSALMTYHWPGNVRELRNAMEHAASLSPDRCILPEDLPQSVRPGNSDEPIGEEQLRRAVIDYAARTREVGFARCQDTLAQVEKALILHALKRHNRNQSEAADYLGMHRNTLRNKLREMNIDSQDCAV